MEKFADTVGLPCVSLLGSQLAPEDIIGIPYYTYFNSGVMVMNLKEFRKFGVQDRFLGMLTEYNFDCLAPDQEYLNVICHGRVKYLPTGWNKHSFPEAPEGELNLCHFALSNKPWHYEDTINGEYFWEYAKYSEFYGFLSDGPKNYSDEDKMRDRLAFEGLVKSIEGIKDTTVGNINPNLLSGKTKPNVSLVFGTRSHALW